MFYLWLEQAIHTIRGLDWPWNWTRSERVILPHFSEASSNTFTWSAGDDYITSLSPISVLNYRHAGRMVMLKDRWYRVKEIAVSNTNRIYIDGVLEEDQTDGVELSFVRQDLAIRTDQVRNIGTNLCPKLDRISRARLKQSLRGMDIDRLSTGEVYAYTPEETFKLKPPKFPPKVVGTSAGSFVEGKYYYFYTHYDTESGLESEPGPVLEYTHTDATLQPLIEYDNIILGTDTGDQYYGYEMRLYRSEVDPGRERCPMFNVDSRSPATPGSPYQDNDVGAVMRRYDRYYDGRYVIARFINPPDSKYRRFMIEHIDSWAHRLHEEDNVQVPEEVYELLHLYLSSRLSAGSRNTQESRAAFASFRGQLNYLLGKAKEGAEDDWGSENQNTDYPGKGLDGEGHAASLVDTLNWTG